MNAWYTTPPVPRPTRKPAVWSNRASAARTRLADLPPPVSLACVLMLLALVTLLAGCATPLPPSSETPRNPSMPAPRQSQPSEQYMDRVLRNIDAWEKKLRDTLPTP
jgi:hypothetical protein